MKKLLVTVLAALVVSVSAAWGQAFSKGDVTISVTIGASSMGNIYPHGNGYYPNIFFPFTGEALAQMEWAPGKYVGAGFTVGFGGRAPYGAGWGWGYGSGQFNVPIGGFCNFHFYQLIADKTGKNIHADKLDIYGGLNLGSGIAFWPGNPGGERVMPMVYFGPTAGIRYYFKPNFGVIGEVGWGKTDVSAGLIWKL
ncbi:MAG: hypothetical protein ACT6QS_11160 [Flavobacteriales bacterium]